MSNQTNIPAELKERFEKIIENYDFDGETSGDDFMYLMREAYQLDRDVLETNLQTALCNSERLNKMLDRNEQSKWIDIKETLPEKHIKVLIYKKDESITIDFTVDEIIKTEVGYSWMHSNRSHVTHWMPFPPAPLNR